MGQTRLLYANAVMSEEAILTPSSEVATLPATFLQDQLRQKPWRTLTGFTIVDDFNNKLDFERPPGTPRVATIPAGTYVSGVDLATAITAALEAADAAPQWSCDYGVAAANTFRIRDAAGAPVNFNLMFAPTAPNYTKSIAICLGYTETDHTGTSTYTAELVSYQSRHFLKINRSDGAAINALAAILLDHTAFPSGSFPSWRIQANATDVWTAPTLNLAYDNIISRAVAVQFFSTTTLAWWRITFRDTLNTSGYFELSKFFLGPYVDPSINPRDDLRNEVEDFSAVEQGVDGTHFVDTHRKRDRWSLAFDTMETADKAIFDALEEAVRVGENFYFCWDKTAPNRRGDGVDGTTYGFMATGFLKQYVPDPYWTYAFPLFEAL